MATNTNKKSTYYYPISTDAVFAFKLDPDIYTQAVATAVGSGNSITGSVVAVKAPARIGIKNRIVEYLEAVVTNGTGDTAQQRVIKILVSDVHANSALTALVGLNIELGIAPNKATWTIQSVTIPNK